MSMTRQSDPHDITAACGGMDRGQIKRASISGVAVNLVSQGLRFVLAFVYQVVMSRLLMPSDFGLVAMATPAVAFITLFADFGLTMATVQRDRITLAQLSFIFWLNCALSVGLAVVMALGAPLVGWFYDEPRVVAILLAMAGMFFLRGLCSQHLALLNRRMKFTQLAVIDLASLVFGAVAGVWSAMLGFGYWSLIVNQAGSTAMTLVLAWLCMPWVPGRPAWDAEARGLLGFGGNVTAFNFVSYFARNLDNVLIGRFAGEAPLGLYDRAYKLLLLPSNQITVPFSKVALPLLARTRREPDTYRRSYTRILESILLLTYPGVLFAMCTSQQLINAVLGERWAEVAPIFAVLAFGALFAPVSASTGWLLVTQDRTREMRDWGMVSAALFVLSFIVGLPWGPLGVAISYIAVGTIQGPLVWWAATRRGPVGFAQLLTALRPFAVAAVATALAEWQMQRLLPPGVMALALLFAAAYAVFVAVLAIQPSGRAGLRDVLVQGRDVLFRLNRRLQPN
ncbi:lipopolysaccharide biosynthesis protein [Azospirillum sp. sgz302134]